MVDETRQDRVQASPADANKKARELPVPFRAGSKHSQYDKSMSKLASDAVG